MSEWDRKYHREKNPKLKTTLITTAIIATTFISLVAAERVAYSITFPPSSENIEIDNISYSADIYSSYRLGLFGTWYIRGIEIFAVGNPDQSFPSGINATRVWLIPTEGGIWPWKDYEIFTLELEGSNSASASFEMVRNGIRITRGYVYFDAIIELTTANGDIYYLSTESEFSTS